MKRFIYFLNDQFTSCRYGDAIEDHLKTQNRIMVYNGKKEHGGSIIKIQNLLIIELPNIKIFSELLKFFNKDKEYWKLHFTQYNSENYPEYFI